MALAVALVASGISAVAVAEPLGATGTSTQGTAGIGELWHRPSPLLEATETAPIFQRGTPLVWLWPTFDTADYVIAGVAVAAFGTSYAFEPPSSRRTSILIDDEVREALRLGTLNQRFEARDASDVLLTLLTAYPFLVDALTITWWHRASPEAAAQMVLIDLQALALTLGLQGLTAAFVGRERPFGDTCGGEIPEATRDCEAYTRNRSFFSGHTSTAFTIAGLVCSHHAHLPINGDPVSDLVPCVGALTAAAVVGTLRMAGDMHYLSDVVVGAIVGSLSGFGVPWLLHYRHESDIDVRLLPTPGGLALTGTF